MCMHHAGMRTGGAVKLGSANKMERFLNTLDNYLQVGWLIQNLVKAGPDQTAGWLSLTLNSPTP